MVLFRGSGVAITTPFNEKKEIDFKLLGDHVEFLIRNNTDCIVVCGTTGESSTLKTWEKVEISRYVVDKVNKRVPVLAGSGSNDTDTTIKTSKELSTTGIDGLLVVTPYYNKATQKGLVKHYTQVANSVDLPIVLYNVPSRTSLNMLPFTVQELSKVENIVALKEACGDISQISQIFDICDKNFTIYSGNDDQVLPILALGGVGVITTVGNIIPKDVHDLVVNFPHNIEESRRLQLKMLNLIRAIFSEVNPIPVKYALNLMGIGTSHLRAPLYEMEENNLSNLVVAMKDYGII